MKLYKIYLNDENYCYFVFAPTRNKAKMACVGLNSDDETYINLRSRTLLKDIPDFPVDELGDVVIVEGEDDVAYAFLKELGFEYEAVHDQE